jgi:ATP-binding cassette, subfamily B, bacterial PglK
MKLHSVFNRVYSMLSASQRQTGVWMIALLVFQSLLDFITVASFLPLVYVVLNPGYINVNPGFLTSATESISHSQLVITLALAIVAFTLLKSLFSFFVSRAKAKYVFGIGEAFADMALQKYLSLSYIDFSDANFSKETNRIVNQPMMFANNIILPLGNFLSEGFVFLFLVTGIALYQTKIFLLLLLVIAPFFLIYRLIRSNARSVGAVLKAKYPLLLKYGQQVVEGFPEIKASGKQSFFQSRFRAVSKALSDTLVRDHLIQSNTRRLTEIVTALIVCLLVIFSVQANNSYQQNVFLLSVYAGASFRMIPSLNRMLNSFIQIRTHQYLLDELAAVAQYTGDRVNNVSERYPFDKQIELRCVSFNYPGKTSLLDNVSVVIPKGKKIAITGNSGEGKSTLGLILLRLLKEASGELLIDGNPLKHEDEDRWRKIIAYISQDPYILDASIAENIAFGVPELEIDRDKINKIITKLGLLSFTEALQEGIDTRIGEHGVKLSGGQRQRIALARALYLDVDILLLDEVTSHLHNTAALEILALLNDIPFKQKTIVMITHRHDASDLFDAVYNLKDGKLSEVILAR